VLRDPTIGLVVNLTNPSSHFEVSKAALERASTCTARSRRDGLGEARVLVEFAEARGLQLGAAPCTVLGEAAQTAWKAVRDGRIGRPRLAYAELDDGPIHLLGMQSGRASRARRGRGADEPSRVHARARGVLRELAASRCSGRCRGDRANTLVCPTRVCPRLRSSRPEHRVLEHESGVTSRVTCTIYGSHDHSLRVFGDEACWP